MPWQLSPSFRVTAPITSAAPKTANVTIHVRSARLGSFGLITASYKMNPYAVSRTALLPRVARAAGPVMGWLSRFRGMPVIRPFHLHVS